MKYRSAVCILFLPMLCFAHSFTTTGHMEFARQGHTATLLADGKVLVTGGKNGSGTLATAEIFHPVNGTFTSTGTMIKARVGHTATLLGNGRVLVAGGQNGGGTLASAEVFHPATGKFTVTGKMTKARVGHTATLLANGKVLLAGGGSATAEVFDPSTGTFTAVGNMSTSRAYQPVVQVQIRKQKLLRYPQTLFVESAHGDGDAQAAGEARGHLDRARRVGEGAGTSVLSAFE